MNGLEVRESGVAAWSKKKCRGLYLKKGYKIRKWAIIGIYGGRITTEPGHYVLELVDKNGKKIRVDTEGGVGDREIFGMINEDIHGEKKNIMLWEHGMIIATEELVGPIELITEYGDEYD